MKKNIGFDDIAGDLFSLNIRGLKSICVLWVSPQDYFGAASDDDWNGRYTPSVRLWLSLVAIASLLQFLWIGTGTPLVEAFAQGFRDSGAALPAGVTYEEVGRATAHWTFAAVPIVQFLVFLSIFPLFAFWGRETSFGLRVRYGFAMMIPGASLMVFLLPAFALVPSGQVNQFGVLIGILAFLIDAITVFRSRLAPSLLSRIIRAIALAGIAVLLNVTIQIATTIAGVIWISMSYGLMAG
ncbi:hypothetical protein [Hyphobacterium sp.]|uniref:hypothetical protein n=1 Tax=Hyphobacterium sp. TaxID=2004662 RepID=UPI003BA98DFC